MIATDDIMEWIESILVEIKGTQRTLFDIEYSKIEMNLESMVVTTTSRTTNLARTTTKFEDVWGNKPLFMNAINGSQNFKLKLDQKYRSRIVTKPPLMFFENYDLFDDQENSSSARSVTSFHMFFMLMLTRNF